MTSVTGLGSPVANNLIPGLANVGKEPAKLAFTQQPTSAAVANYISPAVTVTVEDSLGIVITGDTSSVTLTLNGGVFASGDNTVTATVSNGLATFDNLVINATGDYTLTASRWDTLPAERPRLSIFRSVRGNSALPNSR